MSTSHWQKYLEGLNLGPRFFASGIVINNIFPYHRCNYGVDNPDWQNTWSDILLVAKQVLEPADE